MILKKVKVINDNISDAYPLLFNALENLYNVSFSADINFEDADGIISFVPGKIPAGYNKSTLEYLTAGTGKEPVMSGINFNEADFYGADFSNKSFETKSYEIKTGLTARTSGDKIIATQEDNIIWLADHSNRHHFSAIPPKELISGLSLKDYLSKEDFISLLPLIVYIRGIINNDIVFPERTASIIVDDPNMHADTYGYINYKELLSEAKKHDYHVGIATIPLDNFWASKQTVKLFLENKKRLSPVIHGNNHTRAELLMKDKEEILSTLVQIKKRINSFKSKYSIEIQDAITAPHGMISREMLRAISYFDYSGVVNARPFPWHPYGTSKDNIKETKFYSKWYPADFVDGTPIIPRMSDMQDVPFKLLLNIPCVFTLHHWDFKHGYDFLKQKAEYIRSFSKVNWLSMGEIFRKNYIIYKNNESLLIQLFSKNVVVDIPAGYESVSFRFINNTNINQNIFLTINDHKIKLEKTDNDYYVTPEMPLNGTATIQASMKEYGQEEIYNRSTRVYYMPIIRRVLTETRDRIRPLTKK